MLAEQRYKKVLEIIERDGSVKVTQLIELFGISNESIRRDLEYLEKQGLLRRVYGGAVKSVAANRNLSFREREHENIDKKQYIAEIAMKYISEGQLIALDTGTTTFEVAKALKKNFQSLTVLTNSLAIANELSDMQKYKVILSGGILRPDEFSLSGPIAENSIRQFHVEKSFISVSGISLKEGVTDYILELIDIQKAYIDIADEAFALADSSKIDVVSLSKICDIKRIHAVLTDNGLSAAIQDKYKKNSVNVRSE